VTSCRPGRRWGPLPAPISRRSRRRSPVGQNMVLAAALHGRREDQMSEESGTRIVMVGTVAIPVTDQDRALEFYVGKLGFEMRRDATFGPGMRWIEVAPPGSEATVALPPPGPDTSIGVDTGIRFSTRYAEVDL